MSIKVAINGFGRIGRLAFRQMFGAEGYEIAAINDLTSSKMLAHLLKYDTAQGNYARNHTITYNEGEGEDNYIVVDGRRLRVPLGQAGRGCGAGVHRLLHLQGEGSGPHQGRRP